MKEKTQPAAVENKAAAAPLPPGISMRDYFAAAALTGYIAHHGLFPRDSMPADCYRIADRMIEAGK